MCDAGHSADQHLLTSYHYAGMAVILAQFGPKGFADGMEGVVRLVEHAPKLKASSVVKAAPTHASFAVRQLHYPVKHVVLIMVSSCGPRLGWSFVGR